MNCISKDDYNYLVKEISLKQGKIFRELEIESLKGWREALKWSS